MIDPITLLATVTATYNGIKKAVAMGKEVQDVYKQLSKWAEAADQLYGYIAKNQNKQPGLFTTISYSKSATAEALDLAAAKLQLQEMEVEIKNMFIYGKLQNLGYSGYKEFLNNRVKIREERDRVIRNQYRRRANFIENCFYGIVILTIVGFATYASIVFYQYGERAGKW